jgi:hypothetical protein
VSPQNPKVGEVSVHGDRAWVEKNRPAIDEMLMMLFPSITGFDSMLFAPYLILPNRQHRSLMHRSHTVTSSPKINSVLVNSAHLPPVCCRVLRDARVRVSGAHVVSVFA